MNKELKKLFFGALAFLPLVLGVAAVNRAVDPATLFRRGYEQSVAEIVTSGQNASNLRNMDDRVFEQDCAALMPTAPDTLVLGSSRAMQITARAADCDGLFNAGMTNGELRDMISLYALYKKLGKLPARVILMTDYCMFNVNKLDSRAYTEGYAAFAKRTNTTELKTRRSSEKWRQLFSVSYFQASIRFLTQGGTERELVATEEYETDTDMRRADGSYSYGLTLRGMTDEERIQTGAQFALSLDYYLGTYSPDSEVLRTQFELFVQEMQADGVEVVFQLPPLNPTVYEAVKNDANYSGILNVEQYFRTYAAEHDITVFGSYDAASLGLAVTDFYDALHCSLEATESYFPDALRGGARNRPQ